MKNLTIKAFIDEKLKEEIKVNCIGIVNIDERYGNLYKYEIIEPKVNGFVYHFQKENYKELLKKVLIFLN